MRGANIMKNKFTKPEIEIIKLLTADVVCTSGDLINDINGYDSVAAGGDIEPGEGI